MIKPTTSYMLSKDDFGIFGGTLELLQTSIGYALALGKYTMKKKFSNLKSHDYYIIMQ